VKITALTTFLVPPRWLFLKIDTDAGISGWGEPVLEGRARSVAAMVNELADYLVGKDPSPIEDHWTVLYREGFYRRGGVHMSALAGIDQAHDVALALHCPIGPIALAANLLLDAVCHNAPIQEQSLGIYYNRGNDLLDYLTKPEVFRYEDGWVGIPDGPGPGPGLGLGIEVNEAYARERAREGHRWRNPVWRHPDGSFAEW